MKPYKARVLKDQYSNTGKPKECYALKGELIEIRVDGSPCIAFKEGQKMGFPILKKEFRKINS